MASTDQRTHFERVHDDYSAHYYDAASMAYRREFILGPLVSRVRRFLARGRLADLACGSGHNSVILRGWLPGIRCAGLDISPSACRDYRRLTGWDAYEVDLTRPINPPAVGGPYDGALIIGGLHHCVVDIRTTLQNIAALVRPGGHLLMMEPNSYYALERVRRMWYRVDSRLEAGTEAALNHADLAECAASWFRVRDVEHRGGPAFFLIQNSMITRVPLWLKPKLVPLLFPLERWHARIRGRRVHAFFLAVWERNDETA